MSEQLYIERAVAAMRDHPHFPLGSDRSDEAAYELARAALEAVGPLWLLFAGRDYYPSGGAYDCLGVFYGTENAAVTWATALDVDTDRESWDQFEWKHLATVRDGNLVVVKAWGRGGQPTDEWKEGR